MAVWKWYTRCTDLRVLAWTVAGSVLAAYSSSICDFWIKSWMGQEKPRSSLAAITWVYEFFESRGLTQHYYLLVYWILVLASAATSVASIFGYAHCGMEAAGRVHDNVTHALLRCVCVSVKKM